MNTALRLLLIATLAVSGCFYLAGFDEIAPNQPAATSTGGGTSSTGGHGGNGDTGGTETGQEATEGRHRDADD